MRTTMKAIVGLVAIAVAIPAWAEAQSGKKSLYDRLGGYDGIVKIVDTFGPRLAKDPKVGRFIDDGLSDATRGKNRQLTILLICEAAGGPCTYLGRSMLTSHQGLGITEDDFKIAGQIFAQVLDEMKIVEPEKSELMGIVGKLGPDIVERPKTGMAK